MVECRICGQVFIPELEEDGEGHEGEHRRIICGAMPYDLRELLKARGWELIEEARQGKSEDSARQMELGKRAVVFGWWLRALWNGIPENDCEEYMAAHFAQMDARFSGNEEEKQRASRAIRRWQKYGG